MPTTLAVGTDWNTFWTAAGALATMGTGLAVYYAAIQLRFEAWLKAQEIWVDKDFTDARGRLFRHLREPNSAWTQDDQQDALLVCRRTDEFCRLAPFFAFTKRGGRRRILKVWFDPIAKSWRLLKALVEQERSNVGWNTKWAVFQEFGERAYAKLAKEERSKLDSTAARLAPQITQFMLPAARRRPALPGGVA